MASLGGDQSATIWTGVADVGTYVADATASLSQYYSSTEYQLAGFDIDYEAGITTVVNNQAVTDPQWLSCFCEIITNLKQVMELPESDKSSLSCIFSSVASCSTFPS